MVKNCCIPHCASTLNGKKTSFYKFPSNEVLRGRWIKSIKKIDRSFKEKWQPSEDEVVCSQHFSFNCFSRGLRRRRLKPNACPNIFVEVGSSRITKTKIIDAKNEDKNFENGSESDVEKIKNEEFHFSQNPSLEMLRLEQENFAKERDWEKYHTPRNLLLALVGEVGELSEIFQWRGEVKPGVPDFSDEDKQHLGEELSDVLLYLIRLADKCQIDLPKAAIAKISKNSEKYPTKFVYGSSKKYTQYSQVISENKD